MDADSVDPVRCVETGSVLADRDESMASADRGSMDRCRPSATASSPGDRGVVDDQRGVGPDRRAGGDLRDPGEQPRRECRPVDPGRVGLRDRPFDRASRAASSGSASAAGTGTQTRIAEPRPSPRWTPATPAARPRPARARRTRYPASARRTPAARPGRRRRPARRASRGTRACAGDVEDRLGAGADDGHRRPGELLEVRRDVERRAGAAGAPRWTPPMPPVAKTRIPAAWAAIIVADTVVAAQPPPASAAARLGRAAFRTDRPVPSPAPPGRPSSSPTRIRPSRMAIVAGTAPASRTAASDARATSRFCGYGRPWLMSVDSSATTGRPARERRGNLRRSTRSRSSRSPSVSSGGGRVSWRAAARWPASRAALERRRAVPRRSASARSQAHEEAGVERVAGTGRVGGVDRRRRRDVEPERPGRPPGRARRSHPVRAALDHATARARAALDRAPPRSARPRPPWRTGHPAPASLTCPRRPPPVRQQRPARREVHCDDGAARPRQLRRPPAGRSERLAEQRVGGQVEQGPHPEPGRLIRRARAGRRRRDRRRTSARRRAPPAPRSGPSAGPPTRARGPDAVALERRDQRPAGPVAADRGDERERAPRAAPASAPCWPPSRPGGARPGPARPSRQQRPRRRQRRRRAGGRRGPRPRRRRGGRAGAADRQGRHAPQDRRAPRTGSDGGPRLQCGPRFLARDGSGRGTSTTPPSIAQREPTP